VATKFHLAWFLNYVADEWNGTWGDGAKDFTGDFYVEMAQSLERACFDYILIEDKLMVSTAYDGSMKYDLKHGVNPKFDPVPLAVAMLLATKRLGVCATMSSSFYPPFMLARLASTVDHMSRGRFGWNLVTSAEDRAAQNFGLDRLYEHDERYNIAEEFVEVVTKLWDSWEPDAVVRDHETGLLFRSGDASDFAATIGWAVQHAPEMRTCGQSARLEFEQKFGPQQNYSQLRAIYGLAAEHAAAAAVA